jgi:hypothetical protein
VVTLIAEIHEETGCTLKMYLDFFQFREGLVTTPLRLANDTMLVEEEPLVTDTKDGFVDGLVVDKYKMFSSNSGISNTAGYGALRGPVSEDRRS